MESARYTIKLLQTSVNASFHDEPIHVIMLVFVNSTVVFCGRASWTPTSCSHCFPGTVKHVCQCEHKGMFGASSLFDGRILERTPAQLQARQLRCFSDVLVYDLTQGNLKNTHTSQQVLPVCVNVKKCISRCNECT